MPISSASAPTLVNVFDREIERSKTRAIADNLKKNACAFENNPGVNVVPNPPCQCCQEDRT
jgi:hypothetical protein